MGPMKKNWQYNTIIDLEYFCHQDKNADDDKLHLRDRNIFLNQQGQLRNANEPTRAELIRLWLNERIQKHFPPPDRKSPGTIFGDAYFLAKNLAVIKGIIIGLIAGFSFFTYTGTTPVNVFQFLLLFVVSQLAFVCILLVALFLRPLRPGLKLPSFYSLLFRGIIGNLVGFFYKRWLQTVTTDKKASVSHAFGIFKARSTVYGSLFYWPLFALFQLFAIGFNLGLLSATLIKISTTDLAFGWQSTMQFGATAIHHVVMLAALPWSWFVPEGTSYPSLAEIEGSRIILKEGIYHLTTGNLIAWWPFLVFCLLFYGLFLRMALFFAGKIMERSSLKNLKFDTPDCLALIRRMQTPLISTQAAPESAGKDAGIEPRENHQPPLPSAANLMGQVVLIPDDIYDLCPAEKLAPLLKKRGLAIKEMHRFMVGYEEDQQLKQVLANKEWQTEEGIFIVMEGWMVPLVDFLSYLKELRGILPKNSVLYLGLIGRSDTKDFTPVAPEDFTIWRQKIEATGDPYLTIFSLIS